MRDGGGGRSWAHRRERGPSGMTAVSFFRYSTLSPDVTILLGGCLQKAPAVSDVPPSQGATP